MILDKGKKALVQNSLLKDSSKAALNQIKDLLELKKKTKLILL